MNSRWGYYFLIQRLGLYVDSTNVFLLDLPPVKPSAIALGTIFNVSKTRPLTRFRLNFWFPLQRAASLAVLGPVFGDTYHRAQAANSKEEFVKSKEAASAAAAWGTSLVGSAVQSYGVGALINATGTMSYKGAAYLGSLIFFASSAPSVSCHWSSISESSLANNISSLPKSSQRSALLILSLSELFPVSLRQSGSLSSSHGGELEQIHSSRGIWWNVGRGKLEMKIVDGRTKVALPFCTISSLSLDLGLGGVLTPNKKCKLPK